MKTTVHALILLHYAFGIFYDLSYVNFPKSLSFGDDYIPLRGRLKFLTIINVLLQTLYFTLALLNDFIGTNENAPAKTPLIRKLKDIVFCSLAFPIAIYVSSTFWAIYAIDRELVFPRILDPFFPTWLNHLMHTNIMIFMVLEAFVSFRKYPSRKTGISILSVFLLSYVAWLHVIYYLSGFWVYPFLSVIGWPARICFYLASYALGIAMYFTGEKLNNAIWQKQIAQITKSGKKKAH